jgi:hypothetical protein
MHDTHRPGRLFEESSDPAFIVDPLMGAPVAEQYAVSVALIPAGKQS